MMTPPKTSGSTLELSTSPRGSSGGDRNNIVDRDGHRPGTVRKGTGQLLPDAAQQLGDGRAGGAGGQHRQPIGADLEGAVDRHGA